MAYNTGNPIGSTDPRDLSDNAENADRFVNGTEEEYSDRLGVARKSWKFVENQAATQESEFNAAQSSRKTTFTNFLQSSGYDYLGAYAAGIEFTEYNQYLVDGGEAWFPDLNTTLPYTTTGGGLPEGGALMSRGEAVLRQELGSGVRRADTLADLQSKAGRFNGDAAYLMGRTTAGDGGEGDFRWDGADLSSEVSSDVRAGIYVPPSADPTGASGAWVRQFSGLVNIEWFGAESGTSQAESERNTIFVEACRAALVHSDGLLIVNIDMVTGALESFQVELRDIRLRGRGSYDGMRFKYVISDQSEIYAEVENLATKKGATYVLVGDSLATNSVGTNAKSSLLSNLLRTKISEFDTTHTFYNRAIGGQTFAAFNSTDTTAPTGKDVEWWVDGQTWSEQVIALNPDVVFFSFGMNDSSTLNRTALQNAYDAIKSSLPNCEIVYCTNVQPALGFTGSTDVASQEGRLHSAGLERTFGRYKNATVLDIGRVFTANRDGYDPVKTIFPPFEVTETSAEVGANPFRGANKLSTDHRCQVTFDADLFSDLITEPTHYLDFKLGEAATEVARLFKSATGKIGVKLFSDGEYASIVTEYDWPTGIQVFDFEVREGQFLLTNQYANNQFGSQYPNYLNTPVIRSGKPYRAFLLYNGVKPSQAKFTSGDFVIRRNIVTDSELYTDSFNHAKDESNLAYQKVMEGWTFSIKPPVVNVVQASIDFGTILAGETKTVAAPSSVNSLASANAFIGATVVDLEPSKVTDVYWRPDISQVVVRIYNYASVDTTVGVKTVNFLISE